MPEIDLFAGAVIFAALAVGGLFKGATGAGAPVIAVPVMAVFFDVRLAVMIMVVPNLFSNIWQMRKFWTHRVGDGFSTRFALAGGVGALLGTILLATMPVRVLLVLVTTAVVSYILLRLLRPDLRLSPKLAGRLVVPCGVTGGILQGAAGLSAPISVSFLNAMRLERITFIATISGFFVVMAAAQLLALTASGLLTLPIIGLSLLAFFPMTLFMPVGSWLARKLSAAAFDKLTLALLTVLAVRLLYSILGSG